MHDDDGEAAGARFIDEFELGAMREDGFRNEIPTCGKIFGSPRGGDPGCFVGGLGEVSRDSSRWMMSALMKRPAKLTRGWHSRWRDIVTGVVALALGVLMVWHPFLGAIALVRFIGLWLFMTGILELIAGAT